MLSKDGATAECRKSSCYTKWLYTVSIGCFAYCERSAVFVSPLPGNTSRARSCFLFCLGQKIFSNTKKLERILIRNPVSLGTPVSCPQQWLMPYAQGKVKKKNKIKKTYHKQVFDLTKT